MRRGRTPPSRPGRWPGTRGRCCHMYDSSGGRARRLPHPVRQPGVPRSSRTARCARGGVAVRGAVRSARAGAWQGLGDVVTIVAASDRRGRHHSPAERNERAPPQRSQGGVQQGVRPALRRSRRRPQRLADGGEHASPRRSDRPCATSARPDAAWRRRVQCRREEKRLAPPDNTPAHCSKTASRQILGESSGSRSASSSGGTNPLSPIISAMPSECRVSANRPVFPLTAPKSPAIVCAARQSQLAYLVLRRDGGPILAVAARFFCLCGQPGSRTARGFRAHQEVGKYVSS